MATESTSGISGPGAMSRRSIRSDYMVTSEWALPPQFENGIVPEDLLSNKYGHRIHFWDLRARRNVQTIDPIGLHGDERVGAAATVRERDRSGGSALEQIWPPNPLLGSPGPAQCPDDRSDRTTW